VARASPCITKKSGSALWNSSTRTSGSCLASIEEVAERDRELVVEDVRWRMVDGDVRHMAVDR